MAPTEEIDEPSTVAERVFATDKRPVVLFDGVCNMCNTSVNIALDWDPEGKIRFSALQSNVGRSLLQANGKDADDLSSIVLVTPNDAYEKSDAIFRIVEELTLFGFIPLWIVGVLARLLIPKFFRDFMYEWVGENRYYMFGKTEACRLGSKDKFKDRFVSDKIAEKKKQS